MRPTKIRRGVIEFAAAAARSAHPKEFAGLLRRRGDTIEEVLVLPGTFASDRSAVLSLHMLPIDPSVCGSVHSHPSLNPVPSDSDILFFGKFGSVHLIIAFPYDERSWAAYDNRGGRVRLEVVP